MPMMIERICPSVSVGFVFCISTSRSMTVSARGALCARRMARSTRKRMRAAPLSASRRILSLPKGSAKISAEIAIARSAKASGSSMSRPK